MQKIFLVLVLFLGALVIAFSFSEIETILLTLQKAHLQYFLLAILIQCIWFITTGRMYQSIFHLLGIHEGVLTLTRMASAATFHNKLRYLIKIMKQKFHRHLNRCGEIK